jgi:ribose transport system substrate-binding protein
MNEENVWNTQSSVSGKLSSPSARCLLNAINKGRRAETSEAGKPLNNQPKILVSLITKDNDFQLEQAASAQLAAEQLGIEAEILFADNDAVLQTQQLLSYIQEPNKRPDAIVVEPVGTGMSQVAKAAVSAGIGWVLINAGVDYISDLRLRSKTPVFTVVSNHEEIGRIQGRQIAALLGDEGCVLHIEGPTVRDVSRLRTQGMMSTKPPRVTVKKLKGDWTQHSGYNAIKSWLSLSTSRDLHVGIIAAQNDDMAIGARRAFEEVGDLGERDAWLTRPIIGCDGVPKSGQKWVRDGKLSATVVSPPLVGEAIQLLMNALRNGSQPAETTVVTPVSFPALNQLQKAQASAQGS